MVKRLTVLLVAVGLLAAASLPLAAEPKESAWTPSFNSPADFHQIQVDKDTPAQDVVGEIYAVVSKQKWPEAADNAQHAVIAK